MATTLNSESTVIYQGTVTGQVRTNNEDALFTRYYMPGDKAPLHLVALLAVADGMGGHERGEWASATAVKILEERIAASATGESIETVLKDVVKEANEEIHKEAAGSPKPPGTTLSIAAVFKTRCVIAHVGDTKVFLLRNGSMKQITTDDTLAAMLVKKGRMTAEEARTSNERSIVTKSIGPTLEVKPAIEQLDLHTHDILLLCSDGLTDMLTSKQIEEIIIDSQTPMQAGERLVNAANEAGGYDNASVVVYAHGSWRPVPPGMKRKSDVSEGAQKNASAKEKTWISPKLRMILLGVFGLLIVVGISVVAKPGLIEKLFGTPPGSELPPITSPSSTASDEIRTGGENSETGQESLNGLSTGKIMGQDPKPSIKPTEKNLPKPTTN